MLVATVRGLRWHGGVKADKLAENNLEASKAGLPNLGKHIENVRRFGVPVIVSVNRFADDSQEELDAVLDFARGLGAAAAIAEPFTRGGAGCETLARTIGAHGQGAESLQPYLRF